MVQPAKMSIPPETRTGFLQPYAWNVFLSILGMTKMMSCNFIGMWGLFWYNDGGEMTEACLTMGIVGSQPKFEE